MKKLLPTLIFIICMTVTSSAKNDLFEKKEFIYKGDTLKYRVLYPEKITKDSKVPLILFLHGSGERGNDNEKQLIHGSSLFTDSLNRINYPAIVIFPQCPADQSWVNIKDRDHRSFAFENTKDPAKPLLLAKKLVDYFIRNESVDKRKVYIMGLSLGGMGTYDLICRYPKTFAAAIPICGAVDVARLKKVRKMPIRIYHGSLDQSVSPEYSRKAYIELKAYGSQKAELIEFPGVYHNSWDYAFAQPDFLSWLFLKSR